MPKWSFYDPEDLSTYTFEINPVEADMPALEKNVSVLNPTAGNAVLTEGADKERIGDFSGVILTQTEYDAMVLWFNKRYPIQFTDDLGRTFSVYITQLDATRERAVHSPWKHSYTVRYILLEEL